VGTDSQRGTTDRPVILRQLFSRSTHQHIVQFLDERVPLMSLGLDESVFVRLYAHNVPFFVNIHNKLTDVASDIFGCKLKPSYSFLSMYKDGGICPLHVDRPQCRYTIDYLIRQDQAEPWPIHIAQPVSDEQREEILREGIGHPTGDTLTELLDKETFTTVDLMPNDAVCYSGTHSWHYRSQPLIGTADLVFFHFVPEDFDGPLD
jgi:hypothetical protein